MDNTKIHRIASKKWMREAIPDEQKVSSDAHNVTQEFDLKDRHSDMPPRIVGDAKESMPATLRFFVGDDKEIQFDVVLNNELILGRKTSPNDRQVDVDLNPYDAKELGVSRHHAIIQAHRDRIAIKDFNSSNGTYINDYVLKPMFSYRLQDGDVVQLGKLKLTVEFLPDPS